jgi:hypothetical protein
MESTQNWEASYFGVCLNALNIIKSRQEEIFSFTAEISSVIIVFFSIFIKTELK